MKQNQKLQLENKLGGYKDRIQAMAEHLTNVRQELSQTQVKLLAHFGIP